MGVGEKEKVEKNSTPNGRGEKGVSGLQLKRGEGKILSKRLENGET